MDFVQNKKIEHNHTVTLTFSGDYVNHNAISNTDALLRDAHTEGIKEIILTAEGLNNWDSSLVVFIFMLIRQSPKYEIKININKLPKNLKDLIELAFKVDRKPTKADGIKLPLLERIGTKGIVCYSATKKAFRFIRDICISFARFYRSKAVMRKVDFLFALEDCSYKAVGIVSLVSFMIGLILAFVGAMQLRLFGAEIYIASLVAISMTRIMGAIMMGIIMAGRTGASYAATIGTMQVNEEIDALKTMGIPVTDFLVIPRVTSLIIAMPFLTILADIVGILGGATVGILALNISPLEYWNFTQGALHLNHFFIGLFHSVVYGFIISVCGCYYGIFCGRDAGSVGEATTKAVVSSIVWMIVATGFLTLIFQVLGI